MKKLFKFSLYDYYNVYEPTPKFLLSLNWGITEDRFRPYLNSDTIEERENKVKQNGERHAYFYINAVAFKKSLTLEIKLKKVGNKFYGREVTPYEKIQYRGEHIC